MTVTKFTHHRVGVSSDHRRKKGSSHPLRARCASIAVLRRRGLVQRRPRPARVIHCLKNLLDSFGALKSNQRENFARRIVPVFGAHDRAQGYVVRDANARWRLTGGRLSSHQGVAVGWHIRSVPAHGYANLNGAAQRVGSAQKPSSRAYSGALPGLRSNAYVGRPGCMDRPRAALARSATPHRISRDVLERIGQRWRDDAETAWRGEISLKKK